MGHPLPTPHCTPGRQKKKVLPSWGWESQGGRCHHQPGAPLGSEEEAYQGSRRDLPGGCHRAPLSTSELSGSGSSPDPSQTQQASQNQEQLHSAHPPPSVPVIPHLTKPIVQEGKLNPAFPSGALPQLRLDSRPWEWRLRRQMEEALRELRGWGSGVGSGVGSGSSSSSDSGSAVGYAGKAGDLSSQPPQVRRARVDMSALQTTEPSLLVSRVTV
jgi:hypothetical protein